MELGLEIGVCAQNGAGADLFDNRRTDGFGNLGCSILESDVSQVTMPVLNSGGSQFDPGQTYAVNAVGRSSLFLSPFHYF